jgi:TldD protein
MDGVTDILDKALHNATADLTVLRWMKREQINVTVANTVPRSPSQTTFEGVSCRSLLNGSWGFSSTTQVTDAPETVKTSERLSRISSHKSSGVADVEPVSATWNPALNPVSDIDVLYELVGEASEAMKSVPFITSTNISILIVTDEKILMTSEGTHIYQVEPRIMGVVTAVARESGKISHGNHIIGGEGGLELFEKGYLTEMSVALCKKVARRLHATLPPTGKTPVVLSGEVVGMLAHEALGHAVEADVAQHKSFLSHKIGKRIASPFISIADDGGLPGGFGTMGFDDEGVPAQYTVVIKDGILQSYLHSRETAYSSHNHSTGNARAWLFSREPQVRMTNTYVLPQDMSLEELLQQVNNGLYISGDKKGSADRNGQFAFITTDAQKIEKGEFTEEYFLGPVISGHTQKAFTECTGVGDTKTFVVKPSVCRKGESAFVGSGGPAVATEVVVGGIQ